MIVLGVDPGSIVCGYGVVDKQGTGLKLIEYGIIHVKKKNESLPDRLKDIFNRLKEVIIRTEPEVAVFETIFYSKNAQSLVKLSHARGAAILAASFHNLKIAEYSPREIKKSVTGIGNASKEQVQYMVRTLLKIEETPEFFDATDALAGAICHCFRNEQGRSKSKTWAEFIKKNPDRIVKL